MTESNIQIKPRNGNMKIYSSYIDVNGKDESKRKSRNLSEKKRRDQFNVLINELSGFVTNDRKMDKSTILNYAIDFLQKHNENATKSKHHEIDESWKSPFLTNDQFTHLMLEAVGGFIIVFSSNNIILYVSDSFTSLLGYTQADAFNMNLFTLISSDDHARVCKIFSTADNSRLYYKEDSKEISFECRCVKKGFDPADTNNLELIRFTGFIQKESEEYVNKSELANNKFLFIGTGRLQTPLLLREVTTTLADTSELEFCSHHNIEWKYIFLDQRASSIIGYSPFEILGTSGFDYYHINDLDKLTLFYQTLKEKGRGVSGYYRFLTKGQQWIWLQTKCYVTYHRWFSKPETIFCTHRILSNPDDCGNIWETEDSNQPNNNGTTDAEYQKSIKSRTTQDSSSSDMKSLSPDSCSSSDMIFRNDDYFVPENTPFVTSSGVITGEQTVPNAAETIHDILVLDDTLNNSNDTVVSANVSENRDFVAYNNSFLQTTTSSAADVLYGPSALENNLQKRRDELQRAILQRQEELRLVSEQLLMARCGFYPSSSVQQAETDNIIAPPVAEENLQTTTFNNLPLEHIRPESELTSLDDGFQDSPFFCGMLKTNMDTES